MGRRAAKSAASSAASAQAAETARLEEEARLAEEKAYASAKAIFDASAPKDGSLQTINFGIQNRDERGSYNQFSAEGLADSARPTPATTPAAARTEGASSMPAFYTGLMGQDRYDRIGN